MSLPFALAYALSLKQAVFDLRFSIQKLCQDTAKLQAELAKDLIVSGSQRLSAELYELYESIQALHEKVDVGLKVLDDFKRIRENQIILNNVTQKLLTLQRSSDAGLLQGDDAQTQSGVYSSPSLWQSFKENQKPFELTFPQSSSSPTVTSSKSPAHETRPFESLGLSKETLLMLQSDAPGGL